MALADYYRCDVCGQKAVYDADWYERVHPKYGGFAGEGWHGDMRIICDECAKTHKVIVVHSSSKCADETSAGRRVSADRTER